MDTVTKILLKKEKWIRGASRSWGNLNEEEKLQFTRFFDGDTYNFIASNTAWVSPYEWFSVEDGHEWLYGLYTIILAVGSYLVPYSRNYSRIIALL